jgi:hypothetical protein
MMARHSVGALYRAELRYHAAAIASARTLGEVHDVIDIGVTLLLTLRLALFRPALPQLVDPNNDAWLPEEKNERQECSLL